MRTNRQPRPHRLAQDRGGRHRSWCPAPAYAFVPPGARACCCAAYAVYAVVMTGHDGRWHAPVLLCRHHARESVAAIVRNGGAVYDAIGRVYDTSLIAA